MGATSTDSMASVVTSLTNSFNSVPHAAVPSILDCVLSSTGLSPSSLFDSLLNAFSDFLKDIVKQDNGQSDLAQSSYISSFTTALCYVLKKSGTDPSALQSFILRGYLPVIMTIKANDHQLLNLIAEELSDVVTESNTWKVIEASLVPYSLRSAGISIGMHQNEDSAFYKWNEHSIIHGIDGMLNGSNVDKESMSPLNGSMPLAISCHILTSLLVASLRNCQTLESTPESVLLNGYSEFFCRNLLWDICAMTIRMLSQCPDYRSCATHLLLPFILRIFARHSSFQITVQGKIHVLSRDSFFKEIWKCCQALFCLGPQERGDAYCVLSLYISTFYHKEGENITVCNEVEEFDIRTEQEFWDEIRRGLVAKEAFVRKQSLNMLKLSLSKPDERHCNTGIFENNLVEESSTSLGLTRRGKWAEEEAKSLGVGKTCSVTDTHSNGQQMWDAFVLLYEMLEEYGTHLVEAAWDHQISMLLSFPCRQHSSLDVISGVNQSQMETLEGMFSWLAVLWERGLCHENPQVRCLIMQSFLSINWKDYGTCEKLVHEIFIIGPFIQGLNDPVHHKEFGVKGVYSSETIEGATTFVSQYCKHMHWRVRISLMGRLASLIREESFGRAGLMALSACIASAAYGVQCCEVCSSNVDQQESTVGNLSRNSKADLLDMLRLVTESCRQHFNLNYRHRVCENVLEAASSVICASDVPLETLMHFISTVPRESTDYGGSLRANVQKWLSKCNERFQSSDSLCTMHVMHSLCDYPGRFVEYNHSLDASATYDDGDIEAWELEGQRWARVFLLVITEGHCLEFICEFLRNYGINIRERHNHLKWLPLKFLILNLALVQELQIMKMKFIDCEIKVRSNQESHMLGTSDLLLSTHISVIFENLTDAFLFISEELVLFANLTCSKFWCCSAVDSHLPSSVRGKLGGPSQRRLPSSATTSVLEAILSMKTVASLSTWCAQFRSDHSLDFTFNCLWRFSQKVILSPTDDLDSETGAEIRLAAYEALVHVLKSVASSMTPVMFGLVMAGDKSLLSKEEGRHWLDILLLSFLRNINGLIALGTLARSRRAVLMNWKWLCLNSLLSVLHCVIENEVQFGCNTTLISTASMKFIYSDLVGSLENASENSVLPMLRSVRLIFGLFASGRLGLTVLSSGGINIEMLWELVNSSWILHVSCNKRKIAHIAALLSSVLHCSIFHDDRMHETAENMQGPYKWFIEKILEEGTKSPRTIRLAALHLTGLWLLYPKTVRYYIKELKLLSLFGSVAFDEDFEAELAESQDASTEVSLLAKGSETELTEEFLNTELYARVCVAVLFHQLANLVDKLGSVNETEDCHAALHAGKAFLLELLDSAVNDTDLAKELYKKYSGIHRRKVRAWQMICILSRFVDEDIVQQVTSNLHICLYRNNMPSVRQYLEIFAIQIYLKFPSLVKEQLSPIFRDYNMRPQALSSYVFIAANVILHATEENIQHRHLNELLPLITPLLTSHHHSLRGFSQLLVYKVLLKMVPSLDSDDPSTMSLEKRCFVDLKSYLAKNTDCVRLRASMEGFLDAFDSSTSATPTGLFTSRDEGVDFECAPTSLMEQVNMFLNEVREDLRSAMAKDMVIIKNESLTIGESCNPTNESLITIDERVPSQIPNDISVDFQKKITLSKHESQSNRLTSMSGNKELCKPLIELEIEDQLLNQVVQSRSLSMEKWRSSRQDFILVASLIDRIPNLAGLARTCEVFNASCLAVSDASIIKDKQFQLISVTAEKWVPIIEVPVSSMKVFLRKKKQEGFSILGLEQTANSIPLDQYTFPKKMVLVLGREKEGIPVDIIHTLDACVEIPQLGVVRSLNVHVSGAIALWEYTRQQRVQHS